MASEYLCWRCRVTPATVACKYGMCFCDDCAALHVYRCGQDHVLHDLKQKEKDA